MTRPRRRILAAVVLILATLTVAAGTVEGILEARDAERYPPPGFLVEVDQGRRLHMVATGLSSGGPTIVLEAGGSLTSSAWAWIQPQLSRYTRVVSYDRANYGWSDPVTRQPSASTVNTDLHKALMAADIPGPYLLVGHSIGGYYMEQFARQYPDEVAAIVLLDPTPIGWVAMLPHDMVENIRSQQGSLPALAIATRLGLTRLANPMASVISGLPSEAGSELLAANLRYQQVLGIQADTDVLMSLAAADGPGDPFEVPVLVISSGISPDPQYDTWEEAQWAAHMQIAGLSSAGEHKVLADASHLGLVTDRTTSRTVVVEILDLYNKLLAK